MRLPLNGPVGWKDTLLESIAEGTAKQLCRNREPDYFRLFNVSIALLMTINPDKPRSFGPVHVGWKLPWAFGIVTNNYSRKPQTRERSVWVFDR